MTQMTLRQLRYFLALSEHGSFHQAAAHCGVSQPSLSVQIQILERQLGLTLIEQRRPVLRLTDDGRELARRARSIMVEIQDVEAWAKHRQGLLVGGLRLGAIPSIAPYLLPIILPHLGRLHPHLKLQLHETQTAGLLVELVAGELDCALLALPVAEPSLETQYLFDDPFLLAVSAETELDPRRRVTPADVAEHELLLLEEGHCLRDQALDYCRSVRPDRLSTFGATSLATILQMVANGYGVTLLPEMSVTVEVRDDRIELLRFVDPQPHRTVGLAWRKTSPRRKDFLALGRAIVELHH